MKHVLTGTDNEGDRVEVSLENRGPDVPGAVDLSMVAIADDGEHYPPTLPVTVERDEIRTALFILEKEEAGEL